MANGVDRNRLALVLAVLTRHAGIALGSADVFVSVAGGVRVDEPGADLAVALAVASAARGVPRSGDGRAPLAAFGELGLTGELRHAAHPDRRLAEAKKFGLASGAAPGRRAARPAHRVAARSWGGRCGPGPGRLSRRTTFPAIEPNRGAFSSRVPYNDSDGLRR